MGIKGILFSLVAIVAAIALASCGGSGVGVGFGKTPGIYFVDQTNNRLVWVSDMTATNSVLFDSTVTGVASLANCTVDAAGHIWVIDTANSALVRFDDLQGDGRTVFGSHGSLNGEFLNPTRIFVDVHGVVYVIDEGRNALVRFTTDGATWQVLDLSTWFLDTDNPDLAVDAFGHIYIAGGTHILRLQGMTTVAAMTYGTAGTGDGQFNGLTGICLDGLGKIYVADGVNNRISRINDIGGGGWVTFGASGTGVNQFSGAFGIGIDRAGAIYIGDRDNHRVVRIDDMNGTNWTELDNLGLTTFGNVLGVFPHLPFF